MGFHQSFGIPAFHTIISCSQESWTEPYSSATLWRPWERMTTGWARKKVEPCGFLKVESESYLMLKIGYSTLKINGFIMVYDDLSWCIIIFPIINSYSGGIAGPHCQTHSISDQIKANSREPVWVEHSERMGRHGLRIGYLPSGKLT